MDKVFNGRKPERLYEFLSDVFSIPRPSEHEEQMAEYVISFAENKGLEYIADSMHNVLVRKPASAGMENVPPVLIEGHMDMVAVKTEGSKHDFLKDPIELELKDGWVKGRETSLGADNGCAVAIMLALLDDDSLVHPELECLFTVQEELGMLGAEGFDAKNIRSRRVIGLDAGEEGVFRKGVSCKFYSGFDFPISREPFDGNCYEISVSGSKCGSLSEAIPFDRACYAKLLGKVLHELAIDGKIRIVEVFNPEDSGELQISKAIVRASFSINEILCFAKAKEDAFREEFSRSEPDLSISVIEVDGGNAEPFDLESTLRISGLLYLLPYGNSRRVLERPNEVRDFFGVKEINCKRDSIYIKTVISADSKIVGESLLNETKTFFSIFGSKMIEEDFDPGLMPQKDSQIRDQMKEAYIELFGHEPVINFSHGGNDCVVLKRKIPELDVITTAATYPDYHTVNERLNLDSFEKVYALIIRTLERLCYN